MSMKVYVAIYEHRHGKEVRVFNTEAEAENWRQETAIEYWGDEIGDPVPAAASAEIADRYFAEMDKRADRGEWFSIEKCEVEGRGEER